MTQRKPVDNEEVWLAVRRAKLRLAEESNRLGRHRLYAAIFQAGLTVLNLTLSVIILIHVLNS